MNTLILVFHPKDPVSKVNKRLAEAAEENSDFIVRDMYELYPDHKIDVKKEQELLEDADRIVLQFPMYWYSSPSLLKQWEDDVLAYGWAYGSTGDKLHGKELLITISTGGASTDYAHDGSAHYTVTDLLRPLQATSDLIGTKYLEPFITGGALTITEGILEERAREYVAYLNKEHINTVGTYE